MRVFSLQIPGKKFRIELTDFIKRSAPISDICEQFIFEFPADHADLR
jgi:hypothetical protein